MNRASEDVTLATLRRLRKRVRRESGMRSTTGVSYVSCGRVSADRRGDLAGDEPAVAGQLVDDREPLAHPIGRVDDHADHAGTAPQLPERVAVRRVVAVVAPRAPQRRRAGRAGAAQAAYELGRSEEHTSELQ